MQHSIGQGILAAWTPIVLILFRRLGPARAVPFALFGGFLLLPRWPECGWKPFGLVELDKRSITGLAVALAVVLFDRKSLARFRPGKIDLLMLGYVLVPLVSAAANGVGALRGSLAESFVHLTEWGLPYAVGRIYYGDAGGPRRLAWQVVIAALVYIPVIVFEAILGPSWYLANVFYGIHVYTDAAYTRLGGWRPEGLLSNGIELTEWMGLAATLALWMWAVARWRTSPIPSWLPPPVLVAAALGCRSVYGYGALAIGLVTTALTALVKSRIPLMVLILVPPVYIASRTSGLWDGRVMVDLAAKAGNRGTTWVRILAEDEVLRRVKGHNLALGFGGRWPDWSPDGQWPSTLVGSGLIGVTLMYATLLVPAGLVVWRRPPRLTVPTAETGLALFVVLHAISSLHNMSLIVAVPLIVGALTGVGSPRVAQTRREPKRGPTSTAGSGHATYRLSDITSKAAEPTFEPAAEPAVDTGPIALVLSVACLLYVFGHAQVPGHETLKFLGGLGSALLFASEGAVVAGERRHPLARVMAFGLAFAVLGITFNLALHASNRPVWSADILQGMALSGVVVAFWRRAIGTSAWSFAGLAAMAASWWAFEGAARPFPGSQYLFASSGDGLSLFPVLPWLTLSALGAVLVRISAAGRAALAVAFGVAALGWGQGPPFGPPIKSPLNPTYALLGASLASAAFAIAEPAMRWRPARAGSQWLGDRWLVFFYGHLGVAAGLRAAGLTQPALTWAALALLSLAMTWVISEVSGRLRWPFRRPLTWVVMGVSTLAVGLVPGIPTAAVLVAAGVLGLLFASRSDDLADLMLGPELAETGPRGSTLLEGDRPRYLVRVALVIAILVAPEVIGRLPAPFGTGSHSKPRMSADPPGDEARPLNRPNGQSGGV